MRHPGASASACRHNPVVGVRHKHRPSSTALAAPGRPDPESRTQLEMEKPAATQEVSGCWGQSPPLRGRGLADARCALGALCGYRWPCLLKGLPPTHLTDRVSCSSGCLPLQGVLEEFRKAVGNMLVRAVRGWETQSSRARPAVCVSGPCTQGSRCTCCEARLLRCEPCAVLSGHQDSQNS